MAYNYEYPYVDPNRYNDDWLLNKMKELDINLKELEDRAVAKATENALKYVDEETAKIKSDFDELENDFNQTVTELRNNYESFSSNVTSQIYLFDSRLKALNDKIEADIIGVNARTDLAIKQNNDYIFDELSKGIGSLRVINYFTGARIPIQDMFDYLAQLHATNGAIINLIVAANKTVNDIIDVGESCTNWVLNGNTYITQ